MAIAMEFFSGPFRTLRRYWKILLKTSISEIKFRYAGSILGLFWLVLAPILLMVIYAGVYLVIFRVRPPDLSGQTYVLYVFSGLIPFLGFSEALNLGSSSLSLNKAILLNTVFPAELVPLRAVLCSQAPTAVGLAISVLLAIALGTAGPAIIALPLIWLALTMFVAGLVWVLALLSLVARDIQQLLTFVSMALLIVSPIAYTPEMVPSAIRPFLFVNPLSSFIDGFHEALVFGRSPSISLWAQIIGVSVFSFGTGFWVFQRAKRVFFDYA